jgi:hypothetical protein
MSTVATLIQSIVDSVQESIDDLGPGFRTVVELGTLVTELENLSAMVESESDEIKTIVSHAIGAATEVRDGVLNATKSLADLGPVVGDLSSLTVMLATVKAWQAKTAADRIAARLKKLLNPRPDVAAVLADLEALKELRGGPADTVAFHDYHSLQIAFKSVWEHAFDENLRDLAEQLYVQATALYAEAGKALPDPGTMQDMEALTTFMKETEYVVGDATVSTFPFEVAHWFPQLEPIWEQLSETQRATAIGYAEDVTKFQMDPSWTAMFAKHTEAVEAMVAAPAGSGGKIRRLLNELGKAMSEPHAFDVFAKDSYNYGLLLTHRQEWTPQQYQAGDLRATIPLAPGETRRYSKKVSVKTSRARKEIDKSLSSASLQTSETQRAESEIMKKTDSATNFKMTADTAFKIGIVDVKTTSQFDTHQGAESLSNKKAFREATIKAAQEYKLERNLEISTTTAFDTESTESGEISNPNNEITVTYLFYELQRRYKLHEYLYRVRPVILVAQDVPAPHQIDEAWLIEQRWILGRVLLDDSLRPALDYLSNGFAGDQVSTEILHAQWKHWLKVSKDLEGQVEKQIDVRNAYRDQVAQITLSEDNAKAFDSNIGFFAKSTEKMFGDFTGGALDRIEAKRKYTETLLQNVNDNITDLQSKLKLSTEALQGATTKYADAIQQEFSRSVAINQLRIHVKQNILYYMQAIWAHEPPDQRFFRLYNKQVANPSPAKDCGAKVIGSKSNDKFNLKVFMHDCKPTIAGNMVDLIEICDLDNPLGYKGNYIMFPLKATCYLTTYMLQDFLDDTYGLRDPDDFSTWSDKNSFDDVAREVAEQLRSMTEGSVEWQRLLDRFSRYVNETQGQIDEIVIPTGQLFIEALPGAHPVLEDFKLLHRAEDVRKTKAEVRHGELENLRLASRLAAAHLDPKHLLYLEDPDIQKKVIVEGNATIVTTDS